MVTRRDGWWWSGTAAGLVAVAILVSQWRVADGAVLTGVDVRLLAAPTGELAVTPNGPFLTATGLMPGAAPGTGVVTIRNQTARPLAVSLRLAPSAPELGDALQVTFVAPKVSQKPVPLRLLDGPAAPVLRLDPAEEQAVTVVVGVPAGTTNAGGRGGDVTLRLVAEVEGS